MTEQEADNPGDQAQPIAAREPAKPEPKPAGNWWQRRRARKKAKIEAEKRKLAAMTPSQRFMYTVWSWVSAILVALVVLTPIRVMIVDWNDIPSGSMEPTLLTGDRIFVNKHDFGVRWPIPWTRFWIAQWDTPDRGDICIWHNPRGIDQATGDPRPLTMVKRCIGLPGDTVVMRNGLVVSITPEGSDEPILVSHEPIDESDRRFETSLFVDFNLYEETIPTADGESATYFIQLEKRPRPGPNFNPRAEYVFTLAEDRYLMIGDNRDNSADSRFAAYGPVEYENIYGTSGRVAVHLRPNADLWNRLFMGVD